MANGSMKMTGHKGGTSRVPLVLPFQNRILAHSLTLPPAFLSSGCPW